MRTEPRLLKSTAVQLTLGYAVVFVLSSLLLVGFLWWRTTAYLDREVDAAILADTKAIADRLHDFGLSGAIQSINERVGAGAGGHAIYLLADPTLTPMAGNLAAWPAGIGRQGWYRLQLAYQGKVHATRALYVVLPAGFPLLVGRDVQDRAAIRESILGGLGWTAATALLLAIGGGLLIRRAIFRRVDAIDRAATEIIREDLKRRLPTHGSSDEFDRLAQTINGMLQQIEVLVEGVRNASNAVAHDLRTPLAELRGRLETVLRTRPAPADTFHEVGEAVADLDRVIGIFNALLRLAEIDSGARIAGFREVGLMDIVQEMAEMYAPVAEERGVVLTLETAAAPPVRGDAFLLAQAIGNLVDNAVKYCAAPGEVSVRLRPGADGGATVEVADQGPGIPDEEKTHVTERFFRGASGRGAPGVGLGLSVVAAVARLHGGTLSLADGHPGLIATLALPGLAHAGERAAAEGASDENRVPRP